MGEIGSCFQPLFWSLRLVFLRNNEQFHDGLGFLTNHGLISNTFENSLQQVNPKLTLPYWDFTIESSTAGIAANEHLDDMFGSKIKTPLLQESWFGIADPTTRMVRFFGGRGGERELLLCLVFFPPSGAFDHAPLPR